MTDLCKTILEQYQVRMRRKQKDAFIDLLKEKLPYEVRVEKTGLSGSRNIIIGDLQGAKYVLGAHYDTAPVLPFPNFLTPKNIPVYLLFNLVLAAVIIAVMFGYNALLYRLLPDAAPFFSTVPLLLILAYMFFGIPNKHTANDNTSGVITLLESLEHEEIRERCCIVLFDLEEMGTFGSAAFAAKHKKEMKDKLLINLDCVGEGDHLMFILSKTAEDQRQKFAESFLPTGEKQILIEKASTTLYPSDQANFKKSVGGASFKKAKFVGYYIDRIHTKKDTCCDEKNIALLVEGLKRFCKEQTGKED